MQRYDKSNKNISGIGEVSAYTLLKLNLCQFEVMSKCDLSVGDARHVPMYEEYLSLLSENIPKERIYQYLRGKYHVSESTVKRVVKRLSRKVKV